MKKRPRPGKIILNGIKLEPHELATLTFLSNLGEDIEIIPPTLTPHTKNADLIMNGLTWEMKSPLINSKRAIERIFYRSTQQANNIIFDLRRIKNSETDIIDQLTKLFQATRKARNLLIITKNEKLLVRKK